VTDKHNTPELSPAPESALKKLTKQRSARDCS
jgi:hypothetical protein